MFNQFGDLERCALRPGNVHSAHEWRDVLDPVVARYRNKTLRRYFRGDAAFASPEVYEFLEAEGFKYAIRLPANKVLHDSIAHLLKRPVGRPPKEVRRYYANFSYRAGSWTEPRRVVAKVEWHSGELYPRVGFIVTNLSRPAERVVAFYNQRGTAEQWIKEGKNAIKWTRLSCRSLRNNAVRLQLHALAYNLGNFMRTLALPDAVEQWSLTTLREKLVKIGAKVVSHGRYDLDEVLEEWRSQKVAGAIMKFFDPTQYYSLLTLVFIEKILSYSKYIVGFPLIDLAVKKLYAKYPNSKFLKLLSRYMDIAKRVLILIFTLIMWITRPDKVAKKFIGPDLEDALGDATV